MEQYSQYQNQFSLDELQDHKQFESHIKRMNKECKTLEKIVVGSMRDAVSFDHQTAQQVLDQIDKNRTYTVEEQLIKLCTVSNEMCQLLSKAMKTFSIDDKKIQSLEREGADLHNNICREQNLIAQLETEKAELEKLTTSYKQQIGKSKKPVCNSQVCMSDIEQFKQNYYNHIPQDVINSPLLAYGLALVILKKNVNMEACQQLKDTIYHSHEKALASVPEKPNQDMGAFRLIIAKMEALLACTAQDGFHAGIIIPNADEIIESFKEMQKTAQVYIFTGEDKIIYLKQAVQQMQDVEFEQ